MTGLPSHFHLLNNAIEFANQNHRVISQNVANLNSPEYKSKQLSFEEFIKQADAGTNSMPHLKIEEVEGLEARVDGNNVDLDRELSQLKKNALAHQTLSQLLGMQIGIMRQAIRGQ